MIPTAHCLRMLALLCIVGAAVYAEDDEPLAVFVDVTAPVRDPKDPKPRKEPKAEPDLPPDPIFDINRRLHAAAQDSDTAVIVEVGSGRDLYRTGGDKWLLASEEAGPRAANRNVRSGDPETRRAAGEAFISGSGAAVKKPAPPKPIVKPAAGRNDPEASARILPDESAPESKVESQASERPAARLAGDAVPRFLAGAGLDSDAAEEVARLVYPLKAEPRTLVETATETPAAATEVPPAEVTGAAAAAAAAKDSTDPEKVFADLIARIERDKAAHLAKINAPPPATAAGANSGATSDDRLRVRSSRAATAIEMLLSKTPLGAVAGRVVDAATLLPIPARVKLMDRTDLPAQAALPEGFWSDGTFRIEALSGPANLDISRGRFYPSFTKGVDLTADALTLLDDIVLTRPAALNFAARGWYLADLDMGLRAQRGETPLWFGHQPSLADLVRVARGEDVKILGVPLPWGDGTDSQSLEHFKSAQASDVLLLPVFPGPTNMFHGSALSLGLTDWQNVPLEVLEPEVPLHESFEEVRAKGGLVAFKGLNGLRSADIRRDILPFFPRLQAINYYGAESKGRARLYSAAELPFDTVIGPVYDLFSFDGSPAAERVWFNLLQHGYTLPAIGSGGGSLEAGRVPAGQTFVHVSGALTAPKALQAIKQGNTTISFGPAVFCRILERDMGPGSVLPVDNRPLTLQIEAYASMTKGTQLDRIEIIRNGEIVGSQVAGAGEAYINDLRIPLVASSDSWIVVRVTERRLTGKKADEGGRAWSNPIYFRGPAFAPPAPAVSRVSGQLLRGLTPVAGTVAVIAPGQPKRVVATDAQGHYKVNAPPAATLIFEAPDCELVARRIFEHPHVQREIGALQCEQTGLLLEKLADPNLINRWKFIVAELQWDIVLPLSPVLPTPSK